MTSSPNETFIQETLEGLEELEGQLLTLENDATPELIDDVFRTLHTIKGSAGMFGYDPLAEFTHGVESAFDLVRDGKLGLSRELVDISLRARDHMLALLEGNEDPNQIDALKSSPETAALQARIEALIGASGESSGQTT